jgi:hypothetical protein
MISKQVDARKDGKSSAGDSLRYGQGLKIDKETGEYLDKSHRTRFGNFGLVDDATHVSQDLNAMIELINLASVEMQSNCDLNTRAGEESKIAHFLVSFDQYEPTEAVLRDTEDSLLAAVGLDKNHFSTFLHNDNGHWHLHIYASRIEKNPPHRVCSLWLDQTKRDRVCREIEIRHGLKRDNGMHQVTEDGQIVEIPIAERRAAREEKRESSPSVSDRAKTTEIYSGEKTFQTWANEIRIGDRLKHAKSWQDIHTAAAAYQCEIKPKGAGFVICPVGEAGGVQLSKIGLKNLPAKFGAFQPAKHNQPTPQTEVTYAPGPTDSKAVSHYEKWKAARDAFKPLKTDRINVQRESNNKTRKVVRAAQQSELKQIRASTSGQARIAAVSVAKMQHAVAMADLTARLAHDRQLLLKQLAVRRPGNTFRDYLVIEATKGDNIALGLARKYGVDASTDVLCKRQADKLRILAAVGGQEYRPAPRMSFSHKIERNGTVIYDFGGGRTVTDSAVARQVQINDAAAHSPAVIATALSFAATKFGNTLSLTGSAEFQRLAVETAVRSGLNINFKDPALQAYKQEFAASISRAARRPLTPAQIAKGVSHVINTYDQGRPPAHIIARNAAAFARFADDVVHGQELAPTLEANRASRVHELHGGELDAKGAVARSVLPNSLHARVADVQAGQDTDLRRPGASPTGSGGAAGRDENIIHVGHTSATRDGVGAKAHDGESRSDAVASADHDIQRGGPVRPGVPAGAENHGERIGLPVTGAGQVTPTPVVDVTTPPSQSNKSAQRAVDVQDVDPHKVAPTKAKKKREPAPVVADTPAADVYQVTPPPDPISAHDWLAAWSVTTGKARGAAKPESGGTTHTVIHIALDGIVLDKGRSGAVYPVPAGLALHVGDKIAVDSNGELCAPRTPEQGVGKKGLGH